MENLKKLPDEKNHAPTADEIAENILSAPIEKRKNPPKKPLKKRRKKAEKVDPKTILKTDFHFEKKKKKAAAEKVDPKTILNFDVEIVEEPKIEKKLSPKISKKIEKIKDFFSFSEQKKDFFRAAHRGFFAFAGFLTAIFLIGINFFLGGSARVTAENIENIISTEKSEILFLSGDKISISDSFALFGGEEISTEKGAEISFFDGSVARLFPGAKIKIVAIRPAPILKILNGKMWFLGQKNAKILTKNAEFFVSAASGLFVRGDKKTQISSFRHAIFGKIWSEKNPKKSEIVIPTDRKITLFDGAIPDAHDELRFSKLKKEIHFSNATVDEIAKKNLQNDRRKLLKMKNAIFFENVGRLAADRFLANFIFFPEKKAKRSEKLLKNRRIAFLKEWIFHEKSFGVSPADAADATLDDALFFAEIADPDDQLARKISEIDGEILSRGKKTAAEKIIRADFAILENAIFVGKIKTAEKMATEIEKKWEKISPTPENKKKLDLHREILASALQKNFKKTSGKIFLAMADLDALAVKWESENPALVALEMTQKNFEIIDAFLQKLDFKTAEKLLDFNEKYLKTPPPPNLIAAFSQKKKRQKYFREKFEIFKDYGVIENDRLHAVMKSREEAAKKLEILKKKTAKKGEENPENSPTKIAENEIRKVFSEKGIVVVTLLKNPDGQSVEILDGILPNKNHFSATFFPTEKVLENFKIPAEKIEIKSEIPFGQLLTALEFLRNQKTAGGLEEISQSWNEISQNPLENVDPIAISINKKFLQKQLGKEKMAVALKNITMTDKNTLVARDVRFSEKASSKLSFSYDLEKKIAKNLRLMPENRKIVGEFPLSKIREAAQKEIEKMEFEKEKITEVAGELFRGGIEIDEKNIHFQNEKTILFFGGKFHEKQNVSGVVDATEKIFSVVKSENEILLQNVSFENFAEKMREIDAEKTNG